MTVTRIWCRDCCLRPPDECTVRCARHPAPFVVFEGFGDSSLDFSLRVYVSDVSSSLATQTELCKMILSKFRQSGIEIPFPQQDLHLRDLDGLKAALERALEQQGPSRWAGFFRRHRGSR